MPLDRRKLSGIPFAASCAANKAHAGSRAPNRQTTPHAVAVTIAAHRRSRWYGKFRKIAIGASLAVWTSLILAGFGLMKHLLPRYRANAANIHLADRRPALLPVGHH